MCLKRIKANVIEPVRYPQDKVIQQVKTCNYLCVWKAKELTGQIHAGPWPQLPSLVVSTTSHGGGKDFFPGASKRSVSAQNHSAWLAQHYDQDPKLELCIG